MRALPLIALSLLALAARADDVPDRRNVEVRHTDFEFPTPAFEDAEAWRARASHLRKQILMASGLMPLPDKTPLNPQVFGHTDWQGYSIEKVLLETRPGFYLGGNLYRPTEGSGPFPAVVSPHGHWSYGRIEHGERGSVPARAINLARQGYVVFTYDMVGYNDTRQLPHATIGGKVEELWGVNLLGAQLWDSIRVVDFLESLSEVDPKRIGATGASGGATQVFLLAAVDDRVAFSAPVNMISLLMQGGSPCENAPNLRIETNNVEIAGLMAPRPMLAVSATGDWTRNLPRNEGPALARLYSLLGAPDRFEYTQLDAPHNYNQGSREAMYRFFGRVVLGDAEATHFAEKGFTLPDPSDQLALWNKTMPPNAVTAEKYVEDRIREANVGMLLLRPRNATLLRQARQAFRERLAYAMMAFEPAPNELVAETAEEMPNGEKLTLGRRDFGERIPAVYLKAATPNAAARPTLVVHPEGGAWALSSSESREGLVAKLLANGGDVLAIDAFQLAHAVAPRPDVAAAGRRAETYYTTFNRTDTANRVLDVVIALAYLRSRTGAAEINLACLGETGPWCSLARAVASGSIHMAADLRLFDASKDEEFVDKLFIPHLRKAGDFRAASTLWVEGGALLWNTAPGFPSDWVRGSFEAASMSDKLMLLQDQVSDIALAAWLTQPSVAAQ
ncbi:MAG: acetylxylan esterase [Bryobacterales bacterium]|nr:acetylxylan esterase [Bryobacterales bacterium]